jgi:hypothetical protein
MASGDHQDTSQGPKPTGKKAKKLTQKEQSERFIEAAREIEVDESDEAFDRALRRILRE